MKVFPAAPVWVRSHVVCVCALVFPFSEHFTERDEGGGGIGEALLSQWLMEA